MFMDIEVPDDVVVELDADSIVYRIGGAVDMMGEGEYFARKLLDKTFDNIYLDTKCSKCNTYIGSSTNYRKQVATMKGYKGNRVMRERPLYYDALRAAMIEDQGAIVIEEQEAEDAVGIAAYTYDDYSKFIIGRIDKDVAMIAGTHYNYVSRKTCVIDKYDALRNFYIQLLTGDMGDNIPGLYHHLMLDEELDKAHKFRYSKYKSKLKEALDEMKCEKDMWEYVYEVYKEYGQVDKHGLDRIIEVGQLVWIRRYEDEMWVPPTQRDFDYLDLDGREL